VVAAGASPVLGCRLPANSAPQTTSVESSRPGALKVFQQASDRLVGFASVLGCDSSPGPVGVPVVVVVRPAGVYWMNRTPRSDHPRARQALAAEVVVRFSLMAVQVERLLVLPFVKSTASGACFCILNANSYEAMRALSRCVGPSRGGSAFFSRRWSSSFRCACVVMPWASRVVDRRAPTP